MRLKFDESEPRDDHGRWTSSGFSEETAAHEVRLQKEAKEGITKVDALLNEAVVSADFGDAGEFNQWDQLGNDEQERTAGRWVSDHIDSYEESAYASEAEGAEEYIRQDDDRVEDIKTDALERMDNTVSKFNLDADTIEVVDGERSWDKPSLNVSALRTEDGKELTLDQQKEAQKDWARAYDHAMSDAVETYMNADSTRDAISDRAREDAMDDWNDKPGEERLRYAREYGFANSESTPGLPSHWVWDNNNDENQVDYDRTRAIAVRLAEMRTTQLFHERNIIPTGGGPTPEELAHGLGISVWESWKESSTSNMGLALQYASAEELGGVHRLTDSDMRHAMSAAEDLVSYKERVLDGTAAQKLGMDRLKAYVRAQWETSQYVLSKAGAADVNVYRGMILPNDIVEGAAKEVVIAQSGRYERLTDIKLKRSGAQSTSARAGIANSWNGIGAAPGKRVVLRVQAPATSVLSLPVFGQNVHSESEVVLVGSKGAWKWDAWVQQAPPTNVVPIKYYMAITKGGKTLVIDLLEIDRGQPHWLSKPKKKKSVKYSDDQPRDDNGRWTGGGEIPTSSGNMKLLTLREHVSAGEFIEARQGSTRGGYLSPLSPDDLKGYTLMLDRTGKVGGALSPDGDMTNLFNNGGPKGAAAEVMMEMLDHGGKTADAFDGYLPTLYANFGLVETGRMKFNREYAPKGWNYERDGEPDVVFLAKLKDVPHDEIRSRVFGPKDHWIPPTHSGTYYDDYDKGKQDATAAADLRGGGHPGSSRTHAWEGMDGRPRRNDSGAGASLRGLVDGWRLIAKEARVDHEPDLERSLTSVWRGAMRGVSLTEVGAAIHRKDWDAVVAALARGRADTQTRSVVEPRVASAFLRGATHAHAALSRAKAAKKPPLSAALGRINPQAKKWAEARAGELVQGPARTKEAVRAIVEDAIEEGMTVDDTAKLLRDVIGLDARRASSAANYAKAQVDAGVGGADLWRTVTRFTDDLRASRADTIARTEILMATNAGQQALWEEAQKDGHLDGMAKMWIATDGCCDLCEQLEQDSQDEPIGIEDAFDGDVMFPPLHPNCRCTMGLVKDE